MLAIPLVGSAVSCFVTYIGNLLYITHFLISLPRDIAVPLGFLDFWSLRGSKYLASHLSLVKKQSLFSDLINCAL